MRQWWYCSLWEICVQSIGFLLVISYIAWQCICFCTTLTALQNSLLFGFRLLKKKEDIFFLSLDATSFWILLYFIACSSLLVFLAILWWWFRFWIKWTRSLDNHGTLLLLGRVALGTHSWIMLKNSILQFSQLRSMTFGPRMEFISRDSMNLFALSKLACAYLHIVIWGNLLVLTGLALILRWIPLGHCTCK